MAGTFTDPWQPSGRSTWPDSANDPEHGYMKLPGKRKMIRIRRTMYEGPGNPFQDELDAERRDAARGEGVPDCDKPLPEAPDEVSPTGRSFFEGEGASDAEDEAGWSGEEGGREWREEKSPTARSSRFDRADDGSRYDVRERERRADPIPDGGTTEGPDGTPASSSQRRREHHRSMSFAMPSTREPVASRRAWQRKNSLPLVDSSKATPGSARDTRWYGFYEDLLRDYGERRSGKLES